MPFGSAVSSFRPRHGEYIDNTANCNRCRQIMIDSYSKLLTWKWGPHYILSASAEIITVAFEGMPNTVSFERASLTPKSEKYEIATNLKALHRSKHTYLPHKDHPASDSCQDTEDAQQLTAPGTSQTKHKV